MQLIKAPERTGFKHRSIFLAGGISKCPDWQAEAAKMFSSYQDITLVNPRREGFEVDNIGMASEQIEWEHQYIRETDIVMFWFPYETLCPITLFELGATLERWSQHKSQVLFIGCHPDYVRKFDVFTQARLMGFNTDLIVDDLKGLLTGIKFYLAKV